MKLIVDTHTHTISSGHAYSTLQEMAFEASVKGIKIMAVTDHGPSMRGAPDIWHFGNMRVIPEYINGVRILKGVEANIINYDGEVDMPPEYLKRLDFALASLHDICIEPGSREQNTSAVINALKNPYIDAVAHPGNPTFEIDLDRVVAAAKEFNKLIEINNHSFVVRRGSEENCRYIASKCKEYGVRVVCGSDAHISFDVGKFDNVLMLFEEVDMPEELVINNSEKKMYDYLQERKSRISMKS